MSAFRNVAQGFRNLWGQGGDDEYDDIAEETEELDDSSSRNRRARESHSSSHFSDSYDDSASLSHENSAPERAPGERYPRFTAPVSSGSATSPASSSGGARLRSLATPMRSRDKNIYTLKPKSMDEASLAADYLKTGCAVVVNLEEVERMIAIRIIDFMSGVCYGLEYQGHAMKLGETIFLFTPGDFEISSDETDYGENRDFIFKEVTHESAKREAAARENAMREAARENSNRKEAVMAGAEIGRPSAPERRSWER